MSDIDVRGYQPDDRAELCRICYASGLMGDSMDPVIGSEALFTDYWMTYYLDHEPESTLVVTEAGRPVGYLVGCVDTQRFEHVQQEVIWPRIVRNMLTGRYGLPRPLLRFAWRLMWTQQGDAILRASLEDYPAHLHMNVAPGHRQCGHGSRLMDAYIEYLHSREVPGVHLLTTSHNEIAVPFYERREFRLQDRAPIRLYEAYVHEPVEGLLYVRGLGADTP